MTDGTAPLSVSVVVPTRDRAPTIRRTVDAVLADASTMEVIVVDDASVDETPAILAALAARDERVRPIGGGGGGAARARQVGLEAATGELVVMLDDDVVAGEGLITGHRDRHRADGDPALAVVGFMPTKVPAPRTAGEFATGFYAAEYEAHVAAWERGDREILDSLWSGNMSLRREAWLGVVIHDPAFPAVNHNDKDLGHRMKSCGIRAVFDRGLVAEHAHNRDLDQFMRDAYRQGAGRVLVSARHAEAAFDLRELHADLSLPLRTVVVATTLAPVHRAVVCVLRQIIDVAGRARRWSMEDDAARLIRRVELRRGAVDAIRESVTP